MNSKLRQKAKNNFERDFFKLMNNAAIEKTMENVRKHITIKLATSERRRNYLVQEPIYHTTNFFTENLLAIEMRKTQILMNKIINIISLPSLSMNRFINIRSKYNCNV